MAMASGTRFSEMRGGSGGSATAGGVVMLCDAPTDRDAGPGFEVLDLGAERAVGSWFEVASAGLPERADVAQRVHEVEAGDDDLDVLRCERLVIADDVERQVAGREEGVRERVGQHVAVLAGVGHCRVTDADPCHVSLGHHRYVVGRVG